MKLYDSRFSALIFVKAEKFLNLKYKHKKHEKLGNINRLLCYCSVKGYIYILTRILRKSVIILKYCQYIQLKRKQWKKVVLSLYFNKRLEMKSNALKNK